MNRRTHRSTLRSAAPLALTLLTLACRPSSPEATGDTAAPPISQAATAEPGEPAGANVVVSVDGVEPGGEAVDAALQTEAQWGTDQVSYRARVPADASSVALRFEGVVPGLYGVVAVQPSAPEAASADEMPSVPTVEPLPGLSTKSRGGWAASGATARRQPEWAAAGGSIGPDGRTVPLTLQRP